MDVNIAQVVVSWFFGTVCGWGLTHLTMWHKYRAEKAKADLAVEELKEYKSRVHLDREAREFTQAIPLYIADVEIAFLAIRRSSVQQPNVTTLTNLAKVIDTNQGILRKVLDAMNEKNPGRVTIKASTHFHGETEVILNW